MLIDSLYLREAESMAEGSGGMEGGEDVEVETKQVTREA